MARPEVTGKKPRARKSTRKSNKKAPRGDDRVVYTIEEAGRLIGLGRNAAYNAARNHDFPTVQVGRLILVPRVAFHQKFGAAITSNAS